MTLKLYVWEDVLTDYTSGAMWALAESADHARTLLRAKCDYLPGDDLAKEPEEFDEPTAGFVYGGG